MHDRTIKPLEQRRPTLMLPLLVLDALEFLLGQRTCAAMHLGDSQVVVVFEREIAAVGWRLWVVLGGERAACRGASPRGS